MTAPRLVLASASPARLATLHAAGMDPEVHPADLDEDAVLAAAGPLAPADAVLALARAKARAVAAQRPPHDSTADDAGSHPTLVLGCDSMLELGESVFGKPADALAARERWRAMRGRSGVLHTGHWLIATDQEAATQPGATEVGATASTVVHFADVTDAEIDAYVATGEPLAVAGAFTVDGLGGPFVSSIEGDYHTVVGLSLPLLRRLLAELGVALTDLWRLSVHHKER